jgi:hypothetical protein
METTHKIIKALFSGVLMVLFTCTLFSNAVAQTCVEPPFGLVAWWPGDGNAQDIIGGNNGALVNGATFTSGLVGQAFSFDGVDDYVDYGTSATFNWAAESSFTYDFWLQTTENQGVIISQRKEMGAGEPVVDIALGYAGFNTFSDGELVVLLRDDGGSGCSQGCGEVRSNTIVNDGNWHHIVVVKDGSAAQISDEIKIYVDGALVNSTFTAGGEIPGAITTDLRAMGSERRWVQENYGTLDQRFFNGNIDEFEIFNRVLTDQEIQSIFNAGSAGKCKSNGYQEVEIDIKPGNDPNCFNIDGHGVIPVAILGSADFDVFNIDINTLLFDKLEVRVRGKRGPLCNIELSNVDSFPDLVCHFEDDATSWTAGDTTATITGELIDGTPIEGSDSICVVP